MVAQWREESIETHSLAHFERVNLTVCDLFINLKNKFKKKHLNVLDASQAQNKQNYCYWKQMQHRDAEVFMYKFFFFKQIALLVTLLAILGSRRSYSSHFYKWGIKAQRVCVSSPGLHSM